MPLPLKLEALCQREVIRYGISIVQDGTWQMRALAKKQTLYNKVVATHPLISYSGLCHSWCKDSPRETLIADLVSGGLGLLLSSYRGQTDLYDDPLCGYYAALLGNVDLLQFAMGRLMSKSNYHRSLDLRYCIDGALEGGNWDCLDVCWDALRRGDSRQKPSDALVALFGVFYGPVDFMPEYGYNSSVIEWATTVLGKSTVCNFFGKLLTI